MTLNRLSPAASHRLAIAKEMYLHGVEESLKQSSVSRILAVLNFDYVAETLIKAVLLDKNVKLEKNSGEYKTFYTLISDLRAYYNNAAVISELQGLHKSRNDIQHNASIPSDQDIIRYKMNTKLFFDEICKHVYKNVVTFESISLSYLVDSQNEITILDEMEKAMGNENYYDCVLYAKEAVRYHMELMRMHMRSPTFTSKTGYKNILVGVQPVPRYGIRSLDYQAERYFDEVNNAIKWLLDRNLFPAHFDEIEQLLDPYEEMFAQPPDKDKADQARIVAYNIITGTQWRLKKSKDRKGPIIFDQRIINRGDKRVLILGIASIDELSEVKLKFSKNKENENQINVELKIGLQEIEIDPTYFKLYNELRVSVRDTQNKYAGTYISLKQMS